MNAFGTISGIPVSGYCRIKDTDIFLPMIETETDIQWVESCIRSREEHPESYPDEDIPAEIARSKALLSRLIEKANNAVKPKPQKRGHIVIELGNIE